MTRALPHRALTLALAAACTLPALASATTSAEQLDALEEVLLLAGGGVGRRGGLGAHTDFSPGAGKLIRCVQKRSGIIRRAARRNNTARF